MAVGHASPSRTRTLPSSGEETTTIFNIESGRSLGDGEALRLELLDDPLGVVVLARCEVLRLVVVLELVENLCVELKLLRVQKHLGVQEVQKRLTRVLYALKFEVLQLVHALRDFLGQLERFLMVLELLRQEA